MTDRYNHINLHEERATLETLPDLTQPSESQRAIKTGTHGNFLSKSCFQDAHTRTNTYNGEIQDAGKAQKTHFQHTNVSQKTVATDIKTAPHLNSTSRAVPHLSRPRPCPHHSSPSYTHSLYNLTAADT